MWESGVSARDKGPREIRGARGPGGPSIPLPSLGRNRSNTFSLKKDYYILALPGFSNLPTALRSNDLASYLLTLSLCVLAENFR